MNDTEKNIFTEKINNGLLNDDIQKLIEIANSNDIYEILDICSYRCSDNYYIFNNKFNYLFNKNAKYIKYIRGFYYLIAEDKYIKAKILMKKFFEFNVYIENLAMCYSILKKYNKKLYYIKKCKKKIYADLHGDMYDLLYDYYSYLNIINKEIYYLLYIKKRNKWYDSQLYKIKNNIAFIYLIYKKI